MTNASTNTLPAIPKPCILPSILAADFANLGADVARVQNAGALHIDIMDGHFVPNISFGPDVMAAVHKVTEKPLNVHLMIEKPAETVDRYIEAGAHTIIFHVEAVDVDKGEHIELAQYIASKGVEPAICVKPGTPIEPFFKDLPHFKEVLIMSVEPGFGGQAFMPEMLDKVRALRAEIDAKGLDCRIEIDGGIGLGNIADAAAAGVDSFVAGSSVFKAEDPSAMVDELYQAAVEGKN
ncbi:MAG: ribulose-phosphate 3-epimerase [Corynebacterium sp.]|nr:ribulose-phosphate 3-epimerase [Corynebacterium sp.]